MEHPQGWTPLNAAYNGILINAVRGSHECLDLTTTEGHNQANHYITDHLRPQLRHTVLYTFLTYI